MSDNESTKTSDGDREGEVPSIAEALFDLCTSDELSITTLHETINNPGLSANYKNSFNSSYGMHKDKASFIFHYACMNKNVTLEIIEFLLSNSIKCFPDAAQVLSTEFATRQGDRHPSISETYPLHIACSNEHCPSDVIRFLLKLYPPACEHLSNINGGVHSDAYQVAGLPLHYYLARNKNVDIDTVKLLVEAYPQSLMITDEGDEDEEVPCYPIHALLSNKKTNNIHEILSYMLELEPSSISLLDGSGRAPLHLACRNGNMTLEVVQFIFNKWPEAIRTRDRYDGWLPVHELCINQKLDGIVALEILQFMLGIDPALVRERNDLGYLPIHLAPGEMSIAFCKVLIDTYPESVRIDIDGSLPIHEACRYDTRYDTIELIQYLLEIYPESINARDLKGRLSIHYAAMNGRTGMIELLLKHDPDAASRKTGDEKQSLPLHMACQYCKRPEPIKVLYDAFPEATLVFDADGKIPMQLIKKGRSKVFKFFSEQFEYVKKLNDMAFMTTANEIGWLPLHRALKDDVSLGTIKLMVKKCPAAVRMADDKLAFPLHIACRNATANIVKFLVEHDDIPLRHLDLNKDSILHYACRGGNLDVVKYLITNHASSAALAETNEAGELPLHLFCEAGKDKVDCDSAEYIETIWLMLLANPEVIMS